MFLGIDTSCYTTSVAVIDEKGQVVADRRRVLSVAQGERGLRQNEGVFQHIKNLPVLIEEIKEFLPKVRAIGVSSAPRNVENSYMPVFTAGVSFANVLGTALSLPVISTSHQEGHIMAAATDCGMDRKIPFLSLHLSGGTTEILMVSGDAVEIVGKTLDIPAGQLIDRTGVLAGEKFPCGKAMDEGKEKGEIKLPVSVKGCDINFSGAEIQAEKHIKSGAAPGEVYYAVFECIAKSLEKAIKNAGEFNILPVGGVSSNSVLREILKSAFGSRIYFANPKYMTDNAVGVAYICKEGYES